MLGSPAGPGATSHQRGLWPLAPAPAPSANTFASDGLSRYGVYSLFPGGPGFGGALYSHSSTIGRFASSSISPSSGAPFHTSHKESLFSSAGYTFGAPTPPPGSPYSPVTSSQLELFAKGYNSNIIIQQPSDFTLSPKKGQLPEKSRPEDNCLKIKPEKSACGCLTSPGNRKYSADNSSGCSRTNPIEWSCPINVKKEPGSTPCQVAEVTTSASPIVKVEITSPTQKCPDVHGVALPSGVVTSNGNIPVGIAVARQRIHHHQESVSSPSLPPAGLLTTVNTTTQFKEVSRVHQEVDSTAGMAASTTGGVSAGGTLLQCTDERATGLAGWSMGGTPNSTLATPTLWQYPATLPVEPMLPLPALPVPPVGVQLVRDPSSGHLLLLPTTTGIEQVQQAVVWPSYQQPPSVLLPPLPPPPLQLLSSASSDFLSSSTTLHQHTQTHSTRLLAVTTTDAKRKIPLPIPTTTLIKIEADAATSTLDQTKTLQAVSTVANSTGSVFTEQNMAPLVTTHLIYQHPTNLILSQTPSATTEMACRSQATSPVACLTPPPETNTILEEELPGVQDASNQTDTPFCSEDDNTTHAFCDVVGEAKNKQPEELKEKIILASSPQEVTSSTTPVEKTPRQKILELPDGYVHDNTADVVRSSIESETPEPISSSTNEAVVPDNLENTPPKTPEAASDPKPDISGLELLSNSIFELENSRKNQEKPLIIKCEKVDEAKVPRLSEAEIATIKIEKETAISSQNQNQVDDNLGGLNLLCALAEQRILEEVEGQKKKMHENRTIKDITYWERHERKKEKRKSKKHSSDESRRKRIKTGNEHYRYKNKSSRRSKHESDSERAQRRENGERIYNSDSERNYIVSSDPVPINRVPYEDYYEPKCSSGFTEMENCNCKDHRAYKSRKSEEEVRKYIASKSQPSFIKDDWPAMNAMELDMRLKLAELQRKYKEKQRELSKLKPKKKSSEEKSSKRKKREKKRSHSDRSITPPPLLDKIDSSVNLNRNPNELLKPPTLCAIEPAEHLKIEHHSAPINHLDSLPFSYRFESSKRTYSPDLSDSTPEKISSSKKRKVGRPKKLMSSSGLRIATETIVAKKPKKGTFVGYLLAAKEKFQMQNKSDLLYCNSPPRYVEDNKKKLNKHRTNNNIMCNGVDDQAEKSCKIRPKLKAEPTIKEHAEEEEEVDEEGNSEWEDEDEPNEMEEVHETKGDEDMEIDDQTIEEHLPEPTEVLPNVNNNQPSAQKIPESTENDVTNKKQDNRCILTTEHLKIDKLRVLTVMAGLFYAGHLNAIEPPDVYSITLDGERGNRPHIMSREEILRDAVSFQFLIASCVSFFRGRGSTMCQQVYIEI
ncbi:uncharacterized protein LOC108737835 [Agrilus planipennis]|uniref:Uncharacterized protein LOC108737835 n=1 Tax=Agrilus planipennis TaxID=224129 RepID=A0A1W4WRC2_AGRPL|nr:uncharacterized protein LOC108737835 [Agrilus planipennis]XP_018326456.1 uncharacterized protein LOC108737835 [Agrilus planipennis]XP_018326457.1 uncharacterized protein LOC108737835 [Agrilus planipennis]XP_018326458.1 uncharacterized protein LOC108737835 [Agrilus planipennis]